MWVKQMPVCLSQKRCCIARRKRTSWHWKTQQVYSTFFRTFHRRLSTQTLCCRWAAFRGKQVRSLFRFRVWRRCLVQASLTSAESLSDALLNTYRDTNHANLLAEFGGQMLSESQVFSCCSRESCPASFDLIIWSKPGMSNRNALLGQKLCNYLHWGRTLTDLLSFSQT